MALPRIVFCGYYVLGFIATYITVPTCCLLVVHRAVQGVLVVRFVPGSNFYLFTFYFDKENIV